MEKSSKKKIIMVAVSAFLVLVFALLLLIPLCAKNQSPDPQADTYAEFEFDAPSLAESKLLYPESRGGRIYHVAADGEDIDHADGSEEHPYNLLALRWLADDRDKPSSFRTGDQILLKRGDVFRGVPLTVNGNTTYWSGLELFNVIGDPDNPVTIASYGDSDKKPVIEMFPTDHKYYGVSTGVIFLHGCANVVVRDLEIFMHWDNRKDATGGATGIWIEYDGFKVQEKFGNIYVVNNTVHGDNCDQNTAGISIDNIEEGYNNSADDFLASGIYVYNNLVYNVGRSGIRTHAWIIDNSSPQLKFTIFKDVHMDNNVVHDVGCIGMYAGAATGCTMNRNLVYNTGMYKVGNITGIGNDSMQEGEGGIMAMCLKDSEIMFNVTYGNHPQGSPYDGIGIDIDWNCDNVTVKYNHVYDCEGCGIATMGNARGKIINNRVENNLAHTNQYGQITVSDYVPWGEHNEQTRQYILKNSEDLLSLRYLEVAENLIKAAPVNGKNVMDEDIEKSMFLAKKANGIDPWCGNSFHDNRVVYTGVGTEFYFNSVVDETGEPSDKVRWDTFAANRYYALNLDSFNCKDVTAASHIAGGAMPYVADGKFESWAERDVGATFQRYDPNAEPAAPSGAKATYVDGKLNLTWTASKGDVWHYNVYKLGEGEEPSYLNLLGQTESTQFCLVPDVKGEFYLIVEAESNTGLTGKPLTVKISLR